MQDSNIYINRDALIHKLKSDTIKQVAGSWDKGFNDAIESIIKLLGYFPARIVEVTQHDQH